MFYRRNARGLLNLVVFILLILLSACSESAHESEQPAAQRKPPQIPGGNAERGEELIRDYGCGSCHQIPGIRAADGTVGPPLRQWADRQYIAGTLPNTPENLIHWIRFPQAVEPGTVMPNLDISEEEARDLAAFLYTLTGEGQLTDIFSTPRAVLGGLFTNSEEPEQGSVPNTGQPEGAVQPEGTAHQDEADQQTQQGEQVYNNNCASCHGQNGQGQVGPTLAGNAFVTSQNPTGVIETVLHGRGQMPAFQGQLSDEQLAAVISYIRGAWGNNAPAVSAEELGSGESEQPPGQQSQNQSSQPTAQPGQNADSSSTGTPQGHVGQSGQRATVAPGSQGPAAGQQTTPAPSTTNQAQAGGQQAGGMGQATPARPVTQQVVLVEIYEWGIDLSASPLPAERVLFHVTNVGTQPHRFTIEGQGMELAYPEDLQVGQTRTLLANLRPGQYRIFSPLSDDAQRGISREFSAEETGPSLPGEQQQATQTPGAGGQQGQPVSPTSSGGQGQPTQQPTAAPGGQNNQGSQPNPSPTAGSDQAGQGQPAGENPLAQQGQQVFSSNCASCHGQNGQGQVGPALAGNRFVTQDPAPVIETVLHGRGQMPAFQDQLSNEQIAAVISYIRSAWGNSAGPVSPDQIGGGQGQSQGGQSQGQPSTPGPSAQAQVTIELTIQNRAFDNNTLSVPAGAQVTLNLTNLDGVPHNFALYQDSAARQAIFIGQVFSGPQRTVTMQFTAPASPGSYFFRCDVHPYMNGELLVE